MSDATRKVTYLPVPAFLLELDSERMVDALNALYDAGFSVKYVRGSLNRYRVEDNRDSVESA